MSHLVLIDGHHLMYRAYWAIPRTMQTKSGQQTNAVFGFASMLLAILSIEEPDALVFCFDEGDKTFRHQANETYKDGRAATPDDFYTQIPAMFACVQAFSLPMVSSPQYEADDFLATYATEAAKNNWRTTVVTGDRDAYQLASDKIRIAIPHKGYQQAEYLNAEGVWQALGVHPRQVTDYKGLCGDSSDNLPGVKGIGPKTAASLLQQYDTLEGIYDHLQQIAPAVRQKLEADKTQAFFCRDLAKLVCNMPIPMPLEMTLIEQVSLDPVINFFMDLEFTLLLKRLEKLLQSQYGQKHFVTSIFTKNVDEQLILF